MGDQLRRRMRKVKNSFWIIKPPNLFCGMGIKVINDFKEVPVKKGPLCVQRYLKKPLLIDGLKFDLRVYVLVTSVEPLRVFLYEEGLVCNGTVLERPGTNFKQLCPSHKLLDQQRIREICSKH